MRWAKITTWLAATSSLFAETGAIDIDISDKQSVTNAASLAATNMLTFYNGTTPGYAPGILTNPYYWWEAGAMFGIMIHFWHLTGNDSYNKIVTDGLLWQRGDGNDFEPVNQTKDLGNDDQAFWAYAALDAAEFAFPNPPDSYPSWLALAQAVFNRQIGRWDPLTCNGGIRWQIFPFNPGYTYKNTAANGGLFHIAARLARFTGNDTYATQAERMWDWLVGVDFIIPDNSTGASSLYVIDGGPTDDNCTGPGVDGISWTYNHGTILMGAAYMYNYTNGSDLWRGRLDLMVEGARKFFVKEFDNPGPTDSPESGGNIMSEVACETQTPQTCEVDQPAFKGMLVRWLAVTTQLASYTNATIMPWLNGTAKAAALQCTGGYGTTDSTHNVTGGPIGSWCGRRWYSNLFDGHSGLGEQMSSMSAFQNVLIGTSRAPYTTVTGGNSTSDPNAGTAPTIITILDLVYRNAITKGDTAGAWILTVLGFFIIGGGAVWMVREEPEDSWAGSGTNAGWQAPSAGSAGYYKRTAGYGAYRLAGLSAGGVYKAKNSSARRAFAKSNAPAQGQGSGGWWFGSGRGTGEEWWDRKGEEHVEELQEKEMASTVVTSAHAPHDSIGSFDSRKGLFARFGSSSSMTKPDNRKSNLTTVTSSAVSVSDNKSETRSIGKPAKAALPTKKNVKKGDKDGEWVSLGKGVFVRARDAQPSPAPDASRSASRTNLASPVSPSPTPGAGRPSMGSRTTSARQSRAPSVARGKTLHWPADVEEREEEDVFDEAPPPPVQADSSRQSRRGSARQSRASSITRERVLHWPADANEPDEHEDEHRHL